jgi:hypothetical protein
MSIDGLAKSRRTGENRCPALSAIIRKHWIPAYAGMTGYCNFGFCENISIEPEKNCDVF